MFLFSEREQIEDELKHSIHAIDNALMQSKAADKTGKQGVKNRNSGELNRPKDSLALKDIEKLYSQIPDLLNGIGQCQQWTIERAKKLVNKTIDKISITVTKRELEDYLLNVLLPVFYWQIIHNRVPSKQKNRDLKIYYNQLIQKSIKEYEQHPITEILEKRLPKQLQEYHEWAEDVARSFQRASSQVEGRNGYLAFIHKANRGLSNQRLRVLTVVHNFDTRSYDQKTPVERLFKREFPDLFEFVLHNVTPFPEPRKKKLCTLKTLSVQA